VDNIFADRFIENENARTGPAWHRLGTVINDRTITPVDAIARANINYTVTTAPLEALINGEPMFVDGRVAIVREPVKGDNQWRVFGVAGADYTPVTNHEVAQLLTPLIGEYTFETAGALGYGETAFITLDAGQGDILGEQVRDYFLLRIGHDGKTGIDGYYTPVRVVCQNTLIAGIAAASVSLEVRHHKNVKNELAFMVDVMAQLKGARAATRLELAALARVHMNEDTLESVLTATYPEPAQPRKAALLDTLNNTRGTAPANLDPDEIAALERVARNHETAIERRSALRLAARTAYERVNDTIADRVLAGTGWTLFNAVVEVADWRDGRKNENIPQSALFGNRASEKARAYGALRDLVPTV
jgi:phage/plasmid-like protein (TIGR03299 family)